MLRALVAVQAALSVLSRPTCRGRGRFRSDAGQTTAEYALVLLGAASVALLVIAWTAKTDRITRLLNSVLDSVLSHVT